MVGHRDRCLAVLFAMYNYVLVASALRDYGTRFEAPSRSASRSFLELLRVPTSIRGAFRFAKVLVTAWSFHLQ